MHRRIKLVISDFHVGRGSARGMVNQWENFRHDEVFAELLGHYSSGNYGDLCRVELIINGDFFDLLQVDLYGKFYDMVTEGIAVRKVRLCLEGHPIVTEALKRFIARPGKSIVYLPGNHDMDMVFPRAQQLFCKILTGHPNHPDVRFIADASDYSFDGIRIEHGQQHEAIHAFDFNQLFLTKRLKRPILNLPWGNLFVHNVINRLKAQRPYLDKVKPFNVLILWSLIFDPIFAIRAALIGTWFFLRTRFIKSYVRSSRIWQTFRILREEMQAFPDFERVAQRVLQEYEGIHTIIMGHTHNLKIRTFPDGKQYINTGTWVDTIDLHITEIGRENKRCFVYIAYPEEGGPPTIQLLEWLGRRDVVREVTF